jgi:hypothetical protein
MLERDPRAPVFFVSHAHPATAYGPRRQDIGRFFDDLSDFVATLISRPAGADPGFIDSRISGERWEARILAMLGTCQVLIPLLSADYVVSNWCGMEWHGFSSRPVLRIDPAGSAIHTAIFPVFWAPIRDDMIPAAVSSEQFFMPGDPYDQDYLRNGIFGLQRFNKEAYEVTTWRLAQEISESYYRYEVTPVELKRDQLRNVFQR